MRLFVKYAEKYHRSIIKVAFFGRKNIIFDATFCHFPRY